MAAAGLKLCEATAILSRDQRERLPGQVAKQGRNAMRIKHLIVMCAFAIVGLASAAGQGHGRGRGPGGPVGMAPGSLHSNAPAGTPAASADRDKGRDRAADVGQGKKKGVSKPKHTKSRHAH